VFRLLLSTELNCGGKGSKEARSDGLHSELQLLINTLVRAITGCFRTTNAGELMLESGLRPVISLLNNRTRRFAIHLAALPIGDQARELVGAPTVDALYKRILSKLTSSQFCLVARECAAIV
jgi:hypothetical protein